MPTTNSNSRGEALFQRLQKAIRHADRAPRPGARQLPTLIGIKANCQYTRLMDNVLTDAGDMVVASRRVFRHGNSVVLEIEDESGKQLTALSTMSKPEPMAAALLANLFICEEPAKKDGVPPLQFGPPDRFVDQLLNNEPLKNRIPRIEAYSLRPVFDQNYVFRGPGWHEDVGYLVHGPEVEPTLLDAAAAVLPMLTDRLPPLVRALLRGFCFKGEADLVNAVGVMLTGLLMPQFTSSGKALVLLDGNQPGVGKTLLARVVGTMLDGKDPKAIHFTADDEELAKRACATLRENATSVLLFDNAKLQNGGAINSTFLEAKSVAPEISLRILGQSATFTRPNDLLWFVTMNLTKTSPDLVSRCVPIRFMYEGDPKERDFHGHDPIEFARRHRKGLLGELAGMVVRWNQLGRPLGSQRHRLPRWAAIIGGILDAHGLTGFLTNLDDAAEQFNAGLDDLAALAEAAIEMNSPMICALSGEGQSASVGLRAKDLKVVFERACVLKDEGGSAKSERSKVTKIGRFFADKLGREVSVEVDGKTGKAVFRQTEGGQRSKLYRLEVRWSDEDASSEVADESPEYDVLMPDDDDEGEEVDAADASCTFQPALHTTADDKFAAMTAGNDEDW